MTEPEITLARHRHSPDSPALAELKELIDLLGARLGGWGVATPARLQVNIGPHRGRGDGACYQLDHRGDEFRLVLHLTGEPGDSLLLAHELGHVALARAAAIYPGSRPGFLAGEYLAERLAFELLASRQANRQAELDEIAAGRAERCRANLRIIYAGLRRACARARMSSEPESELAELLDRSAELGRELAYGHGAAVHRAPAAPLTSELPTAVSRPLTQAVSSLSTRPPMKGWSLTEGQRFYRRARRAERALEQAYTQLLLRLLLRDPDRLSGPMRSWLARYGEAWMAGD